MYRQKRKSVLKPSNESVLLYYGPGASQPSCCNISFSVRYAILTGKYLPTSTSKWTCLLLVLYLKIEHSNIRNVGNYLPAKVA
jgi:hypothetical protein